MPLLRELYLRHLRGKGEKDGRLGLYPNASNSKAAKHLKTKIICCRGKTKMKSKYSPIKSELIPPIGNGLNSRNANECSLNYCHQAKQVLNKL
jgi:hypothetical protein